MLTCISGSAFVYYGYNKHKNVNFLLLRADSIALLAQTCYTTTQHVCRSLSPMVKSQSSKVTKYEEKVRQSS